LKALGRAVGEGERICHLHFFHGAPEELMLLLLCRLYGRKIVLTVHDIESFAGESKSPSRLIAKAYPMADRFVVHNETSRRELMALLHVREERIAVIPHGNYVDTLGDVPAKHSARETLGIAASSKVILFFGQIKAVKGMDLLLEAMPVILRDVPEAVLLIAGRPWKNNFTQYEERMERLGIRDRCVLHIRYIPDEEVSAFYACADVIALPYRRIYQSGVLLLAMSYQRAVVVSDLPGMMDVVREGQNGYAFSTGSADALAKVTIEVLKQDGDRERVAAEAFAYVTSKHDWRVIGAQTAAVYRALMGFQ
jgi:glycosyltransferase involved in cell wall biosynthesis